MKRALVVGAVLLVLAPAGFAVADVGLTGDSNGTLSPGQSFTVTVSDDISNANGNGPTTAPYAWCGPEQAAVASGWFSVGPLSSSSGGHMQDLSVSCTPVTDSTGTWHYRGSMTLTVPADAGPSMWVSVAVEEYIPMAVLGAAAKYDYNFNRTYAIATPSATSTAATTTAPGPTTSSASTSATVSTATSPQQTTTSSATTTTATATASGTTTTASPTVRAPKSAKPVPVPRLTAPSEITASRSDAVVALTVKSNERSPQTLCWRRSASRTETCASARGSWHVKLRSEPGVLLLRLEYGGRVVARRTVVIKLGR
jgi:hypothetical protein